MVAAGLDGVAKLGKGPENGMSFLPVVERELRVRARHRWTYLGRVLAAAVPLVLVGFMGLSSQPQAGRFLFDMLIVLASAFCILEGVRNTADCLSEERREGTLGLLFLTDLRGYDVVLGKFAAASLGSIYGFLATIPVLGLSLLLGGVTFAEFWRSALALLNLLFGSLALGILVSTFSRRQGVALATTALGAVLWCGGPLLCALWPAVLGRGLMEWGIGLSPVGALQRAGPGVGYWFALLEANVLAWAFLMASAWCLPRVWQENQQDRGTLDRWFASGKVKRRRQPAGQALDEYNPLGWLVTKAPLGIASLVFLLAGLGAVLLVLQWSFGIGPEAAWLGSAALSVLAFFLKIRLAWSSSEVLAELRRSGMLEILLVTPVGGARSPISGAMSGLEVHPAYFESRLSSGLVRGIWKNFQRHILILVAAQMVLVFVLVQGGGNNGPVAWEGLVPAALGGVIWGVNLYADCFALVYAGLWFGLRSGKAVPAFAWTLGVVLVPAGLVCCFGRFLPSLILGVIFRQRLQSEMRLLGHGPVRAPNLATADLLPRPSAGPAGAGAVPPVIRRPPPAGGNPAA